MLVSLSSGTYLDALGASFHSQKWGSCLCSHPGTVQYKYLSSATRGGCLALSHVTAFTLGNRALKQPVPWFWWYISFSVSLYAPWTDPWVSTFLPVIPASCQPSSMTLLYLQKYWVLDQGCQGHHGRKAQDPGPTMDHGSNRWPVRSGGLPSHSAGKMAVAI